MGGADGERLPLNWIVTFLKVGLKRLLLIFLCVCHKFLIIGVFGWRPECRLGNLRTISKQFIN